MAVRAAYEAPNESKLSGRGRCLGRGQTAPGDSSGIVKRAGCGVERLPRGVVCQRKGRKEIQSQKQRETRWGGGQGERQRARKENRPPRPGKPLPPSGTHFTHCVLETGAEAHFLKHSP